jgi:hypothetical protein
MIPDNSHRVAGPGELETDRTHEPWRSCPKQCHELEYCCHEDDCYAMLEPPEPDGECFRGNEAASYLAEQQARIQRELK